MGANIICRILLTVMLGLFISHSEIKAQAFFIDSETASYIDAAAFSPGNNVVLFFSGSAIMIYDVASDTLVESEWYELGDIMNVESAVSWDDDLVLLFNGTSYQTFEVSSVSFTTEPAEWSGLPEEWEGVLDAAVRWSEDEVMFFKDGEYVLYSFSEDAYVMYESYVDWEGFPEHWDTGLEAVLNIGGDIYFLNDGEVVLYSKEDLIFYQSSTIGFNRE